MICVLTYDNPHRKTHDFLFRLKALGYNDIMVVGKPWVEMKRSYTPLLPHRPPVYIHTPMSEFCERLGFNYHVVSYEDLPEFVNEKGIELVLVACAGILPAEVVNSSTFVNSHPGFLPYVRGLDSFKWAIYRGEKIGVTLHITSPEADAGWLLKQELVDIYPWDTFHSLAYRQFELETNMLIDAIPMYEQGILSDRSKLQVLSTDVSEVHKRMPHRFEVRLLDRLNKIVNEIPID
ncbi:hypothetical protein K8I28_12690 [bacterium]|nr:hypothetical protein [bacterium]